MISEVLCTSLFSAGGINTLEPVIVHASESFAESWNQNADASSTILPGIYFGTVFRDEVAPGPPTSPMQVDNWGELFDIWVFDCWVCNLDRCTLGNILMTPTRRGTWQMIAADQSDCFCGASVFGSGGWRERMLGRGSSEGVLVAECIARHAGVVGLRPRIEKCRVAMASFGSAVDRVPPQWWADAEIEPINVEETLWARLDRLAQVLNVEAYGEFDYEQFGNVPIIEL
jgi:hypothetical protein